MVLKDREDVAIKGGRWGSGELIVKCLPHYWPEGSWREHEDHSPELRDAAPGEQ